MNKSILLILLLALSLKHSIAQDTKTVQRENISRILNTLASDEMMGRSALRPEIAKAADFLAHEFKEIGLSPYAEDNFRQTFTINKTQILKQEVIFDGKTIEENAFLITGNGENLQWNQSSQISQLSIGAQDNFSEKFREIIKNNTEQAIVLVDKKHAAYVARFKFIYSRNQTSTKEQSLQAVANKVFVVGDSLPSKFEINVQRKMQDLPMFNVAATIPGKSKPDEYVVFSAHYDHIGILEASSDQDSIANGADDDASGTTALIELARYYKALGNNERTLIFVAFTAEEIGMYGSKYFSNHIDPEKVIAMINIEMIGKDSRFGPNSLYITGYDASNLGLLMQENLKGTDFTFHPDPYKTQNLFYRSDNAVLAALGVPAHTFSSSQIDNDPYYHTVKDEVLTLKIDNIQSSIEAIAAGAIGIIKGVQTPSRVEKLRD